MRVLATHGVTHPQVIRIEDLDVDGIEKMDLDQLEVLQGQKMKAYAVYKDDLARQRGVQRCDCAPGLIASPEKQTSNLLFLSRSKIRPACALT